MTLYYLDTSVALHALFGTAAAEAWFDDVTASPDDEIVSSRILRTELTRVLRREGLPVGRRDEVLNHVALIRLTEAVLAGAEAIADHVKTLDATHLASALTMGSDAVLVSHDRALVVAAQNIGLDTLDPLAGPAPET